MMRRATKRVALRAAQRAAVVAALGLGLGACSDSRPTLPPPATTSTVVREPLGFSDADNGRSATVAVGQRVTVILHSSDFVFAAPSDPAVVRADGEPTVASGGEACVEGPGSGCGTVVSSFVGLAPGDAELVADRAGCAEPACAPADSHWQLHLHVIDAAETSTTAFGSEVRGTVLFSPVCPVEVDPPDPACAPRPGAATVELARPDGIVVGQDRAGNDGIFSIRVPPGDYTVVVFGPDAAVGGGCQADPPELTVEADTSTTISVSCDTGIR